MKGDRSEVVIIEADCRVGLMVWNGEPPPYIDRAKPQRFTVDASEDVSTPLFTRERFERCGTMFDGRVVYCAPRYETREAAVVKIVTTRAFDIEHIDEQMRTDMNTLVREEYGRSAEGVFQLDQWLGDVPWEPWERAEKEAQCLRKRGLRTLFVVRKW